MESNALPVFITAHGVQYIRFDGMVELAIRKFAEKKVRTNSKREARISELVEKNSRELADAKRALSELPKNK